MDGRAPAGGPLPGDDGRQLPGPVSDFGPALVPEPGWGPVCVPEDDGELDDLDEHFAWLVREIDAGRGQPPPEAGLEGPAISISLGDACDLDPELLAAMCGPDGLGGEAVSAAFGQDRAADVLRPSPVLAAVTAQVVSRAASGPVSQSASRPASQSVSR